MEAGVGVGVGAGVISGPRTKLKLPLLLLLLPLGPGAEKLMAVAVAFRSTEKTYSPGGRFPTSESVTAGGWSATKLKIVPPGPVRLALAALLALPLEPIVCWAES